MNPATAVVQLHAWAQREAAAQAAILAALEAMDGAARATSSEELAQAVAELQTAMSDEASRSERRQQLTAVLAQHFGVSPSTLSLASILERAESAALVDETVLAALRATRSELVERVQQVDQRAKRMSAVAAHQRGVLRELLEILVPGAVGANDGSNAGTLVNAEA